MRRTRQSRRQLPAASEAVEVLGVCHLESLPQVALALAVLRREEGLQEIWQSWELESNSNPFKLDMTE